MENILRILECEAEIFSENGNLSQKGYEAYNKLINILIELKRIGVIIENIDDCEKRFDEIIKLGF